MRWCISHTRTHPHKYALIHTEATNCPSLMSIRLAKPNLKRERNVPATIATHIFACFSMSYTYEQYGHTKNQLSRSRIQNKRKEEKNARTHKILWHYHTIRPFHVMFRIVCVCINVCLFVAYVRPLITHATSLSHSLVSISSRCFYYMLQGTHFSWRIENVFRLIRLRRFSLSHICV